MSSSLSDQLLKAGLVDKTKHHKAQKAQHKQNKKVQKGNAQKDDEATRLAQQAAAEKRARDQELNRQQKQAAEEKAIIAQIRQLIHSNRRTDDGEIAYNFTDNNIIKTLMLSEQTQQQLSRGFLSIVKFEGAYSLVPSKVAQKIAARDESYLIKQPVSEAAPSEDDPYAEYEVPDDLMW